MTHTELGVTHILEISPRGFANEVSVLPVTHAFLRLAEESAEQAANDVNAWGQCYPWDEAPADVRQRAGQVLRSTPTAEDLERVLTDEFLAAFAADPDAYDLVGGQWVATR